MDITYASINEKGTRSYQEDTLGVCIYENKSLFAAADGLGGHGHGDLASQTVMEYVLKEFSEECEISAYFQKVFFQGNKALCRLQDERGEPGGMKTTLACTVVEKNRIYGAYVGDTRIYIFAKGKLAYRSLDHSVSQMLAAAGELNEKKIRNHPDRNRLLRVLGDREREVKPQIIPEFYMKDETVVLLCTDGFWENVLEEEMEKTLAKSKNPEEWTNRMKKIVRRRGRFKKQDNYSAVSVWISPV